MQKEMHAHINVIISLLEYTETLSMVKPVNAIIILVHTSMPSLYVYHGISR